MQSIRVVVCLAASAIFCSLPAQAPRIGLIDFYGLRKVPQTKIRQALGVKEGDFLPASKGDAEERVDEIPGVVESHLEAVPGDAGQMVLYVGIEERGAPHFELREAPEGDATLSEEIVSTYRRFLDHYAAASRSGDTEEDLTRGHARSADPQTRAVQDMFPVLAKDNLANLRDVLKNGPDEEQRAIAAYVIGYAPKKYDVVNDLQFALKDADAGVRANAARSLVAIAVLARRDPDLGIRVSPTWFIEMLNSLSWSDRYRAVRALQILTDKPDTETLQQLRERALQSLVEMARWKTLAHALPAYLLLGRMAGLPDADVQESWSRGDRESVIVQAISPKKRR